MEPRTRLRRRLTEGPIVVAPGAYDALVARLIEQAGFEAVYLSGAGVSYTRLGRPDIGLLSFTEMVQVCEAMAEAVGIPVIADGDTGYGNALNVQRTVRAYERAGVAAIQLEDQTFPKRCGHLSGKAVAPADEMVGKIKAACDARRDPDFLVIARTDARATDGMDEALDRARRYAEAGADVLFVEAPQSVEELRAVPPALPRPCLANMVERGRTPLVRAADLDAMGYRIVIFPNAVTRFIARQAAGFLARLAAEGGTAGLLDEMIGFEDFNRLLGLAELRAAEERYR
ncbi:MAG TPA: oxaloacetate decarboxylase [Thermodesulfobacteriota bacterium]